MQDGVKFPHAQAPIGIERDLSTTGQVLPPAAIPELQEVEADSLAGQGARDTIDPDTPITRAQTQVCRGLTQVSGDQPRSFILE